MSVTVSSSPRCRPHETLGCCWDYRVRTDVYSGTFVKQAIQVVQERGGAALCSWSRSQDSRLALPPPSTSACVDVETGLDLLLGNEGNHAISLPLKETAPHLGAAGSTSSHGATTWLAEPSAR